jgi:hypothetical protein
MHTQQKITPGSLFECSSFVFIIICVDQKDKSSVVHEQAVSIYTACLPKDFKVEVRDVNTCGLIQFADGKILCE